MKKQFLSLAVLLTSLTTGVFAQTLNFETTSIDYGTIEQAANGVREFHFTNAGTEPLIITNAKQSCGCTIPKWPKEPIMPGESAVIKVKYDTKRLGVFSKSVAISSNDPDNPMIRLYIKGNIQAVATTPEKTSMFTPQ